MFDKNWIRLIVLAILLIAGLLYVEQLNLGIKEYNKDVAKLSKASVELAMAKARVEEIIAFGETGTKSHSRANQILLEIPFFSKNEKINLVKQDVKSILSIIDNEEKRVIDKKALNIQKIRELLTRRNTISRLLQILSFLFIIFEMFLFIIVSKRVRDYLSNLSYKKYDFEMKVGLSPFQNANIKKIEEVRKNLKILDEAIEVTLKGYGVEETIREIYENKKFKEYLKFDRIGFATIVNEMVIAEISFSSKKNLKLLKGFSIPIENSNSLMHLRDVREVRILNDLEEYYHNNPKSKSTKLVLEEGYKSSLTAPVVSEKGTVEAFLFFSSIEKNSFNNIDKKRIKSITDILGFVLSKHMLIDDLLTSTALSFVKLVEGKDPETSNHLERMALYSRIIAEELHDNSKYTEEIDYFFIESIYKYAPLHDIGKVGIPDSILLKPGKLDAEEFEIMKQHSLIGAKVLSDFDNNMSKYERNFFEFAKKIAVAHHEKWNGTGYPSGLVGDNIPIAARIVSVADVFDALASKRVYKEAYPFDACISIVKELSTKSFDPEIVEAFIRKKDKIRKVYDELKEV